MTTRENREKAFREGLPAYALEYFDPALRDELGAGHSLCVAAPNHWRGWLAVFFQLHAPRTNAFREIVKVAWLHDHREVIAAAGTKRDLQAMFRRACFKLPDDLPEQVTVYRGTSALEFSTAKRGYSWTTDKRVAAFFALRFSYKNGCPLVLRATVPKSSILFYSNERCESEAICFSVRGAKVDGSIEEWRRLDDEFSQYVQKWNEDMRRSLRQDEDMTGTLTQEN